LAVTDDSTAILPPTPPPPEPPQPHQGVPFYKRGWFISLAAVLVLLLGYSLGSVGDDPLVAGGSTTTTGAESTTTREREVTTSAAAPDTTTSSTTLPPTSTTSSDQGFEPITVSGSGDDVIEFSLPSNGPGLLELTHEGEENFIVRSFTADNEDLELLVNVIGHYTGTRPINFDGDPVGLLEIQADGAWTLTGRPLTANDFVTSPASGTGDDVVEMTLTSASLDVTHTGESNFVVYAWPTGGGRDLLVNEIGEYSGTVRTPNGVVIFEVQADGEWTLKSS
jgi:hypothetical protein